MTGKRRIPVAALLVMACISGQTLAQCQSPVWGAGVGILQSRWQESGDQGEQLVQESGTLVSQTLDVSLHCKTLQWQAQLQRSQGQRDYSGQTTTGGSAASTSDLDIYTIQLQAMRPLSDTWAWGGRLRATEIRRNINSTATAQGYPEQFDYWQAMFGVQLTHALSENARLVVAGWTGWGPAGSMRLRLPIADEATLSLGTTRVSQASAAVTGAFGSGADAAWTWRLALDLAREDMGQGNNSILLRNGVPFGITRQPQTVQTTAAWQASVQYRF